MPWFMPIGRSKTTRSFAYCVARRSAALPSPTAFRRDEDALRIHAVQDVFEAAAFLADPVFRRNASARR